MGVRDNCDKDRELDTIISEITSAPTRHSCEVHNKKGIHLYYSCCYQHDIRKEYKNIERHTADTIISWPYPKQWVRVHTSDLMMIIRQSIYILSVITTEMGKLKTYRPTYCIMDNGENMLNLTHITLTYIMMLFLKITPHLVLHAPQTRSPYSCH